MVRDAARRLAALGLAAAFAAAASAEVAVAPELLRPAVVLLAESGEGELRRLAGDPLLLEVRVANDVAGLVAGQNAQRRRWLAEYGATEEFRALPPAERERFARRWAEAELPVFELGSEAAPLRGLIRFRLRGADGREADLVTRPLPAARRAPARVRLADDDPVTLPFGADPGALAGIGGDVAIWAELDSRAEPEMWQGVVRSRELRLRTLAASSGLADEELQALGFRRAGYFLADERFAEAEGEADALLARFPRYIGGWIRKGDAAAGGGKTSEALAAFRRALRLYYEPAGAADGLPLEHPEYTARRIAELEAALTAGAGP